MFDFGFRIADLGGHRAWSLGKIVDFGFQIADLKNRIQMVFPVGAAFPARLASESVAGRQPRYHCSYDFYGLPLTAYRSLLTTGFY